MSDRLDRELATILEPLGVEQESSTPTQEEKHKPARPLAVILYDKEDEGIWKSLQKHLNLLMRRWPHINWTTHQVENHGWICELEEEITDHINQARLIVIGLSVSFLLTIYEEGSYIFTTLKTSCMRQRENDIWTDYIQPVILRPISELDLDLGCCRTTAPSNYKSLVEAKPRDAACVETITLIETALKELVPQQ